MVLSKVKRLNTNETENMLEINLDTIELFLDQLLCDDKFSDFTAVRIKIRQNYFLLFQTVHSYLIRVKILQDTIDFNDIDQALIEDEELKQWLLSNNFYSLLAEFYFEFGRVADALLIWKEYSSNVTLSRQQFEPLTNRLLSV